MCLVVISSYSAEISKMLKYAEIKILKITVEHLDIFFFFFFLVRRKKWRV